MHQRVLYNIYIYYYTLFSESVSNDNKGHCQIHRHISHSSTTDLSCSVQHSSILFNVNKILLHPEVVCSPIMNVNV